jgi:NarL family two-component system response regulator LiaR
MVNKPIRVLIVDDHTIIRKGIIALLETETTIEVIGEAEDGYKSIREYFRLKPDVMLLDLILPDISGIDVIKKILKKDQEAKIVVLTSFAADDQVFPAIQSGAMGYLLKDTDPENLIAAIHQVHKGESSLSPVIARKVMQEIFNSGKEETIPDPLTKREIEVLQVLVKGKTNQNIAEILSISESTVRKHVSNILGKLQLATRTEAALYAIKEGIIAFEGDDTIQKRIH